MPLFPSKNECRVEIVKFSDDLKDDWENVSDNSDQAWLYHRFDWHRIFKESWNPETFSFLVALNGKIIGIFPMQRHMGNPILFDSQAMGTGGLAVLNGLDGFHKSNISSAVYNHLASLIGNMCQAVRIFLPPCVAHFGNAMGIYGSYEDISTQTYVIDLAKTEDEIFASFSKKSRWCVRKALREFDFDIYHASSQVDIDDYYRLHVETYTRTGANPHPKEYFDGIWKYFGTRNLCNFFMAKLDGEVIAADNVAIYKNWALYWTGASSGKAQSTNVNRVLQWEAIKWAKAQGCAFYESGEGFPDADENSKLGGLTKFKRSFGGKLIPFKKVLIR